MALPTGKTLYGAVMTIGTYDCGDATVEMTLTLSETTGAIAMATQ